MKKTILILAAAVLFASGCVKCYECTTSHVEMEVCRGSYEYDLIQSGSGVTDIYGEDFICLPE
jgi:hypothetical protein